MLSSVNLNDKTYDELLAEAIAQIPLYSDEWTNFNLSDPGITMLQNLTAFGLLQQTAINEIPEEIRYKLLKLAGYEPRKNRAATALVQAPAEGRGSLPAGHQLWSGNISFETTEEIPLAPWGLAAVYTVTGESCRELTPLLKAGTDVFGYPFSSSPQPGSALVCVFSGTPPAGEMLRMWLQIAEEELRTPFADAAEIPPFMRTRWQVYMETGWQDAWAEDDTIGLLRSGEVRLQLPQEAPGVLQDVPVSGWAVRCLLEKADYDRIPRLQSLAAHLFPMKQMHSRVRCFTASGEGGVLLRGTLAMLQNLMVFVREEEDGPYFLYRRAPGGRMGSLQGRFYLEEVGADFIRVDFSEALGFVPCAAADAVRVVCFDHDMIHHRRLGPVYGYDGQVIQLDLVKHVLPEEFLAAVVRKAEDGTETYRFLAPGETGPDGLRYHLRSLQAQLVIDEPGWGGCELLLAGCAVTEGGRGNVRAGAVLEQRGGYDGTEVLASFLCPAPGKGGVSAEDAEDLRLRFARDMKQTTVAVRTQDYEALVKKTPGLCIHKVKAVPFGNKNLVKIAVKPYTEEVLPKLSEDYLRQIQTYLEPYRMLTTRFEICQPQYVRIGVRATLSVRGMASFAQAETEKMLQQALDYVHGPQNFGEWVRFHDIYQKLKGLPFVDTVDDLSLFPEGRGAAVVGSDIRLPDDSLCCSGNIQLTIREYGR